MRWEGKTSHTHRSLKAAEQLGEEGVVAGQGQDPLLSHGALHIVILQDHVLLQHLHSVQVPCFLYPGEHHLERSRSEREGHLGVEGVRYT